MTELETIMRAKMYLDKLANGINPLDDTRIPDDEVVNQVRLSRCFFFVSDVLRRVIENGGINPPAKAAKQKKASKMPFDLPFAEREAFDFSQSSIPITEICHRLNALIDTECMKKIAYREIRNWLVEIGMLEEKLLADGKKKYAPTANGQQIGILSEERNGMYGPYEVVLYGCDAQHFIVDNLDGILQSQQQEITQESAWSTVQDNALRDLYRSNTPMEEIAAILKQTPAAVEERIRQLNK